MSLDFSLYATDQDGNEFEVLDKNITHNLTSMAREAGVYEALWRPSEINATTGKDIIHILENGLEQMTADPPRFKKHNPDNGWGSYIHFLPWIEEVLEGCRKYPSATIHVSR